MGEREALPAADPGETTFELGTWIGRRQVFGLMASRATAADVECLKTIRERRLYKPKVSTWAEFCERYVGFTKTHVDRLIQQLEEFGPNYFHISQMLRISAESYRSIAGAVREDAIEFAGEKIPIRPEHSRRIADAVQGLLEQAEQGRAKARGATGKSARDPARKAPLTPGRRMERMRRHVDRYAAEFSELRRQRLASPDHAQLAKLLEESASRLAGLVYHLPGLARQGE